MDRFIELNCDRSTLIYPIIKGVLDFGDSLLNLDKLLLIFGI